MWDLVLVVYTNLNSLLFFVRLFTLPILIRWPYTCLEHVCLLILSQLFGTVLPHFIWLSARCSNCQAVFELPVKPKRLQCYLVEAISLMFLQMCFIVPPGNYDTSGCSWQEINLKPLSDINQHAHFYQPNRFTFIPKKLGKGWKASQWFWFFCSVENSFTF